MPLRIWPLGRILATLPIGLGAACADPNDIAKAVTLNLDSVDGVGIPATMTSAAGRPATIGK